MRGIRPPLGPPAWMQQVGTTYASPLFLLDLVKTDWMTGVVSFLAQEHAPIIYGAVKAKYDGERARPVSSPLSSY